LKGREIGLEGRGGARNGRENGRNMAKAKERRKGEKNGDFPTTSVSAYKLH